MVSCVLQRDYLICMHRFYFYSRKIFVLFCLRYIVALLSFVRYLSVLHKTSWLNRLFEQHNDLSVLICVCLAFSWSLPPLFEIGNRFIREGVGFYCSLDWTYPTMESRIFLLSLIFFNYALPFLLSIYSNLRVVCTLRQLLKSYSTEQIFSQVNLRKCLSDAYLQQTTNRLQRLKVDRHYAFLTALITIQYLVAWTPYACIELLNVTGQNTFIQHNPFLSTLCALLAKLSLILNPIILIYTNQMTKES